MFYLSFQAASAGARVWVDAVLLEAGRRGPARRVLPGRLLRSHGGIQNGETGQGRVAAAAHVERHVCRAQRMKGRKKKGVEFTRGSRGQGAPLKYISSTKLGIMGCGERSVASIKGPVVTKWKLRFL